MTLFQTEFQQRPWVSVRFSFWRFAPYLRSATTLGRWSTIWHLGAERSGGPTPVHLRWDSLNESSPTFCHEDVFAIGILDVFLQSFFSIVLTRDCLRMRRHPHDIAHSFPRERESCCRSTNTRSQKFDPGTSTSVTLVLPYAPTCSKCIDSFIYTTSPSDPKILRIPSGPTCSFQVRTFETQKNIHKKKRTLWVQEHVFRCQSSCSWRFFVEDKNNRVFFSTLPISAENSCTHSLFLLLHNAWTEKLQDCPEGGDLLPRVPDDEFCVCAWWLAIRSSDTSDSGRKAAWTTWTHESVTTLLNVRLVVLVSFMTRRDLKYVIVSLRTKFLSYVRIDFLKVIDVVRGYCQVVVRQSCYNGILCLLSVSGVRSTKRSKKSPDCGAKGFVLFGG